MTYMMDKEKKLGLMDRAFKASSSKARKMGLEITCGLTVQATTAIG
jgi:hypothetical protein